MPGPPGPPARPRPRSCRSPRSPAGRAGSVGCPPGPRPTKPACSCVCQLLVDGYRKRECKGGALAQAGLDADLAPVHLHDALDDRETEPGAALLARARRVGLLELLEYPAVVGLGDAGAG